MDYTLDKFSEVMKERYQNSFESWEKKGDSDMVEWIAEKWRKKAGVPPVGADKEEVKDVG